MALPPGPGGGIGLDHLAILRALLAARQGAPRMTSMEQRFDGGPRAIDRPMPPGFLAALLQDQSPRSVYRGPVGGPSRPPDVGDTSLGGPLPPVHAGGVGESHADVPFTRVPGRRYYTYGNQAGLRVRPGQQLRFTRGLGYWVGPQVAGFHPYQPF